MFEIAFYRTLAPKYHKNLKGARGKCMGKHLVFTLKRGLSFCRRTFEGLTVPRSVEKGAVVQLHFPRFKGLQSQTGTHYQIFVFLLG